jgi:hypothetical protein
VRCVGVSIDQAHYKFSRDGVQWHTSPRQTYPYEQHFSSASAPSASANASTSGSATAGGSEEVEAEVGAARGGRDPARFYWRVERPQLFFPALNASSWTVGAPSHLFNGVCGNRSGGVDDGDLCLFKQGGMTHTIARPLRTQAAIADVPV